MKKTALIFFCLLLIPVSLYAASTEEARGIEEDKRKSLVPTEVQQLPAATDVVPKSEQENSTFLSELRNKEIGSVADALRAISIVLDRKVAEENIYQEPLTRGQVAMMLCKALELKGGLWLRLFGVNQRYALRELVYEGIISSGSVQDLMSGRELISTLNRAADYLARYHVK